MPKGIAYHHRARTRRGAARAARGARRHRADLRPGMRDGAAPQAQARHRSAVADQARRRSTRGSARIAATARAPRTASRWSRSRPSSAASAPSTRAPATRTCPACEGFCPSFVTLVGAEPVQKPVAARPAARLPEPVLPEPREGEPAWNILLAGVGGQGVTALSAILGMAAHLGGPAGARRVDMLGLAQKGGGVFAQLRIGRVGAAPETHRGAAHRRGPGRPAAVAPTWWWRMGAPRGRCSAPTAPRRC